MSGRLHSWACALLAGAMLATGMPAAAQDVQAIPRFQDRVCPGVIGLQREAAEQLVGRLRGNAEGLGLPQANAETCEPNIVVAMVDDSRAYLRQLAQDKPYLFEDLGRAERARLLDEEGPSRTLKTTAIRSRDGMPVFRRENLVDIPQTTMWMAHSKIYTATRRDILYALVLFDRDSVRGKSAIQLADYATMQALLADPPGGARNSILTLFDGEPDGAAEVPRQMTEYDRAYLAAMYEGPANLPADVRMAEVEQRTRALDLVSE